MYYWLSADLVFALLMHVPVNYPVPSIDAKNSKREVPETE